MADVQKNDIGTIFRLTVKNGTTAVDISSATATRSMIFTAPSGASTERTIANVTLPNGGSDGKIQYISQSGDINETGEWRVQASVAITAGTFKSSVARFDVGSNL